MKETLKQCAEIIINKLYEPHWKDKMISDFMIVDNGEQKIRITVRLELIGETHKN
jgi:hypothetical protein